MVKGREFNGKCPNDRVFQVPTGGGAVALTPRRFQLQTPAPSTSQQGFYQGDATQTQVWVLRDLAEDF